MVYDYVNVLYMYTIYPSMHIICIYAMLIFKIHYYVDCGRASSKCLVDHLIVADRADDPVQQLP